MSEENRRTEIIKKYYEEKETQERLHEKHQDVGKDVKIIETSNSYKFTIKAIRGVIKTVASIICIMLIMVGLFTLLYKNIRSEFIYVFQNIFEEIKNMVL